jgi:hypothetical protein
MDAERSLFKGRKQIGMSENVREYRVAYETEGNTSCKI